MEGHIKKLTMFYLRGEIMEDFAFFVLFNYCITNILEYKYLHFIP